ncbi:FAD-dependent oxidoreductase [Candidatus Uhrbacteria bacterium]|nr:FAD-dependent oxidoreductase [Candidatus Uhrbacteria bacterium]
MATPITYDIVIIGGGISGPADAYTICRYLRGVGRVALVEKEGGPAQINSGHEANSQTLHFGEIETNFDLTKALGVKYAADLVAGYLERHPDQAIFVRRHKMVIAVGADEVARLTARSAEFVEHYPGIRLLSREEIAAIEPRVMEGRNPTEHIVALYSPDGFIVNYGALATALIEDARQSSVTFDTYFRTKVQSITRTQGGFTVQTDRQVFRARAVVVTAGGHSLLFAKAMGYETHYELLPVAGSFYRTSIRDCVTGKVYTMQIEGIPFAATHADPEVTNPNETRFGPTAKMLPLLERHRYGTIFDFLRSIVWNPMGIFTFFRILFTQHLFWFAMRNLLLDFPLLGKWMFLRDVRKIIPSLRYRDLLRARGVGGIRPQIVDTRTGKMVMGEGKYVHDGIIFSVTPSPGASVCLRAAEDDAKSLAAYLGATFDGEAFRRDHARIPLDVHAGMLPAVAAQVRQ